MLPEFFVYGGCLRAWAWRPSACFEPFALSILILVPGHLDRIRCGGVSRTTCTLSISWHRCSPRPHVKPRVSQGRTNRAGYRACVVLAVFFTLFLASGFASTTRAATIPPSAFIARTGERRRGSRKRRSLKSVSRGHILVLQTPGSCGLTTRCSGLATLAAELDIVRQQKALHVEFRVPLSDQRH